MPVPQTLAELRSAIVEHQERLTARQRDAAHYLNEHPHDVALNTVAALAKISGIPSSAFIRLAQALGFSGFAATGGPGQFQRTHPALPG
jgi:DNA-binding MurR/RpiR family transcriptional regulator